MATKIMETAVAAGGEELANPRLYGIAQTIRNAVLPVLEADLGRVTAKEGMLEASQRATGLRMEIMVSLAAASAGDAWTDPEIAQAAEIAANQSNEEASKRTLATFIGECKHAMHAEVREHVPALVRLCDEVWKAEAQAPRNARPAHMAFRRLYHMTIASFRLARGRDGVDGMVLSTPADVTAWADLNNPDTRVEAVSNKLRRIRAAVTHFAEEFPLDGLKRVGSILDEIDARQLKMARDRKTRAFGARERSVTRRSGPLHQRTGLEPVEQAAERAGVVMPENLEEILDNVLAG